MLSDLKCGELIMLTALEALVNGCHGVGSLLPKVHKCGLKTTEQAGPVALKVHYLEDPVPPHVV